VSAAIHGDEINGVEIVRQVLDKISPSTLRGTLLAIPVVNVLGFIEKTRYLPDGRDLNRSFPGTRRGSLASRMARLFMDRIVRRSSYGVDLHTASGSRTNLPQVRGDLGDPVTLEMAKAFAAPVALESRIRDGSLRAAATKINVPVLLYEGGEAHRFDEFAIDAGTTGVLRVMNRLGMGVEAPAPKQDIQLFSSRSTWTRAQRGGVMRLSVNLGDRVTARSVIGQIADPFGSRPTPVRAARTGIVIGLSLHPLVAQGDGIVHIAELTASAEVESL